MGSLVPKIIGFIVIVITLALAPSIYTANLTVVNYTHIASFTALSTIAPYGGFLIILGLLITQGIFTVGQVRGTTNEGWKSLYTMIGSVVGSIIILNLFSAAVLPAFYSLIGAATTATDTIGETIFAVIPIVIYLVIVIGAMGISGYEAYHARRKGKHGRVAVAAGY